MTNITDEEYEFDDLDLDDVEFEEMSFDEDDNDTNEHSGSAVGDENPSREHDSQSDTKTSQNVSQDTQSWGEELAKESAKVALEIEQEKAELIAVESIPDASSEARVDTLTHRWIPQPLVRVVRSPHNPKEGQNYPSIFYGYAQGLERRPPLLIKPNSQTYEVSATHKGSDKRWEKETENWLTARKFINRAKNDAPAKEMRENMRIDERDVDMMFFLSRFRNATPVILAYLVDVPVADVLARLRQLGRAGLVLESTSMGGPLYTLSSYGYSAINQKQLPRKNQSQQWFNHNMGVMTLAAILERGEHNPFSGDPVPFHRPAPIEYNDSVVSPAGLWGGACDPYEVDEKGMRRGFRCVSETELASAFSAWSKEREFSSEEAYWAIRRELEEWNGKGLSPELMRGNEHLFMTFDQIKWTQHPSDLIVKLPRGENGKPRSIAVEVEMTAKSDGVDYYLNRFQAILTCGVFGEVHYFCPSKSVANVVRQGAEEAMLSGELPGKIAVHELDMTMGGAEYYQRK